MELLPAPPSASTELIYTVTSLSLASPHKTSALHIHLCVFNLSIPYLNAHIE